MITVAGDDPARITINIHINVPQSAGRSTYTFNVSSVDEALAKVRAEDARSSFGINEAITAALRDTDQIIRENLIGGYGTPKTRDARGVDTEPRRSFLERMADDLGVEPGSLIDALTTALMEPDR